jgi:GT2 family glycosyltransferase
MPDTAVVIASWNGRKCLKGCFDSLVAQTSQNFEIIFVDNGSEDGSVDFVRKNYANVFSGRLEFVRFEKNTGFAKGYNAGIERALADKDAKFILILNNDTKLDEKCVEELVNCAKKYPTAGSIQPKVLNFFELDKVDCAGILFSADGVAMNRGYGEKDGGKYSAEEEIFGANGTAALYSRTALEETQLKKGEYFDNDFFAYHEDADLAWRMRLAGFKSYFRPEARLFHIHSATANRISGFKAFFLNRNRFFTLIKNFPAGRLFFAIFVLTPVRYLLLLVYAIMKEKRGGRENEEEKKRTAAKMILKAWGSVVVSAPSLLKKRRAVQKRRKVSNKEIRRWFREYGINFSKTF